MFDEFEYKEIINDLEDDINELNKENRNLLNKIKNQEMKIHILIKIINFYNIL